jgi:anaerobic magnesium-protoporphyrin IX monomethyl ester cyclase
LGGRGCPYDCTYCSNHALRKAAKGNYVRMRSPDGILGEVEFLYKNYPHRRFFIELETLDCYKSWTTELCSKLAEFNASVPDPVSFGSNYRINPQTIDESLFSALEQANFKDINIGLESGSERIRRDVLKRNYTNDDFLKVVAIARKHGLKIFLYNMIGLPGESLDDHRATVQLNRLVQPDGHHTGIFYPYPGTALYTTCIEKGLIQKAPLVRMERKQPIMALPDFSKAQIRNAYTWFNYHVYRGHKPVWRILSHVVEIKVNSSPLANLLFQKTVRILLSRVKNMLRPHQP